MAPEIDGVDDAEDMLSARDALTMLGKGTSPEKVQGTSPEKGQGTSLEKGPGYQSRNGPASRLPLLQLKSALTL